jgi:hypothetical protein
MTWDDARRVAELFAEKAEELAQHTPDEVKQSNRAEAARPADDDTIEETPS